MGPSKNVKPINTDFSGGTGGKCPSLTEADETSGMRDLARAAMRGALGAILLAVAVPGLVAFSAMAMDSDRRVGRGGRATRAEG